jgi:hypothetical protein
MFVHELLSARETGLPAVREGVERCGSAVNLSPSSATPKAATRRDVMRDHQQKISRGRETVLSG